MTIQEEQIADYIEKITAMEEELQKVSEPSTFSLSFGMFLRWLGSSSMLTFSQKSVVVFFSQEPVI